MSSYLHACNSAWRGIVLCLHTAYFCFTLKQGFPDIGVCGVYTRGKAIEYDMAAAAYTSLMRQIRDCNGLEQMLALYKLGDSGKLSSVDQAIADNIEVQRG